MRRKIIIFNHLINNYTISNPVILMANIFKLNKKLFRKNNFKIVYFRDLIANKKIFDSEINDKLKNDEIIENYKKTFDNLIDNIENYKNSIFIAFTSIDYNFIFDQAHIDKYLKNNIKTILWNDDLHSFFRKDKILNYDSEKFSFILKQIPKGRMLILKLLLKKYLLI